VLKPFFILYIFKKNSHTQPLTAAREQQAQLALSERQALFEQQQVQVLRLQRVVETRAAALARGEASREELVAATTARGLTVAAHEAECALLAGEVARGTDDVAAKQSALAAAMVHLAQLQLDGDAAAAELEAARECDGAKQAHCKADMAAAQQQLGRPARKKC
jgi:hypothetical protein